MYRIARNAIADHHRGGVRRPLPSTRLLGRVPDGYRHALELTDLGEGVADVVVRAEERA